MHVGVHVCWVCCACVFVLTVCVFMCVNICHVCVQVHVLCELVCVCVCVWCLRVYIYSEWVVCVYGTEHVKCLQNAANMSLTLSWIVYCVLNVSAIYCSFQVHSTSLTPPPQVLQEHSHSKGQECTMTSWLCNRCHHLVRDALQTVRHHGLWLQA